jgi:hypothetical protein
MNDHSGILNLLMKALLQYKSTSSTTSQHQSFNGYTLLMRIPTSFVVSLSRQQSETDF